MTIFQQKLTALVLPPSFSTSCLSEYLCSKCTVWGTAPHKKHEGNRNDFMKGRLSAGIRCPLLAGSSEPTGRWITIAELMVNTVTNRDSATPPDTSKERSRLQLWLDRWLQRAPLALRIGNHCGTRRRFCSFCLGTWIGARPSACASIMGPVDFLSSGAGSCEEMIWLLVCLPGQLFRKSMTVRKCDEHCFLSRCTEAGHHVVLALLPSMPGSLLAMCTSRAFTSDATTCCFATEIQPRPNGGLPDITTTISFSRTSYAFNFSFPFLKIWHACFPQGCRPSMSCLGTPSSLQCIAPGASTAKPPPFPPSIP